MILVTGGTGLVGTHLLASLVQKHDKVRAIHRKSSNLDAVKEVFSFYFDDAATQFSKIEWIVADITDVTSLEKVFEGITYVYHVAALVSFNPKEYHSMRSINIDGTANIVNFSITQKVKKICFVSSIAAIDKTHKNGLIDETGDWTVEANNYGYAITKYGAEMEVWRASQEGLNVVVVNPGVIIGAGNWSTGSGQLFSKIDKGLSYYPPLVTGFVAVEDVVKSMVLLMLSGIKNEGFILVAESLSFKIVLTEIAKALKKPEPRKKLQPWMVFIGWLFQYIGRKLFNTEQSITKRSIKSAFGKSFYDHSKIVKRLDFKFTPIQQSIKETASYFTKTKA